jgi:hypothetical protein
MLAADQARLASIGYLATRIDRRPPSRGLRLVLDSVLALIVIGIVLFLGDAAGALGGFGFISRGRITATFDLVASDHHPVPVTQPLG